MVAGRCKRAALILKGQLPAFFRYSIIASCAHQGACHSQTQQLSRSVLAQSPIASLAAFHSKLTCQLSTRAVN